MNENWPETANRGEKQILKALRLGDKKTCNMEVKSKSRVGKSHFYSFIVVNPSWNQCLFRKILSLS